MRIQFDVDGIPCEFFRSQLSGSAKLRVADQVVVLQRVSDPASHVSMQLERRWEHAVGERVVIVEKRRPLVLAAFRPHDYRVLVDGDIVVEKRGF